MLADETDSYLRDIDRALSITEQQGKGAGMSENVALQFRYALIYASVNHLATNIPPALIGELLRYGLWTIDLGAGLRPTDTTACTQNRGSSNSS